MLLLAAEGVVGAGLVGAESVVVGMVVAVPADDVG